MRPKELLAWSVGIVMALILTVYACDFLWFEYRKWTPKPNDPLESFHVFLWHAGQERPHGSVLRSAPKADLRARALSARGLPAVLVPQEIGYQRVGSHRSG